MGIEPAELPQPFPEALGAERAERLERQIQDKLIRLAYSPASREELSTQAKQLGAATRALNKELSARVAELEERRAVLADELMDTGQDGRAEQLRSGLDGVRQELDALSSRPDHPDRWIEQNGGLVVDALAARRHFRMQRERAHAAEQTAQLDPPGRDAPQHGPESPGVGLDPF